MPMIFWFVASLVVSYVIADELAKAAKRAAEQANGLMANKDSNVASIAVIYGERKVGGTRVFIANSGEDNKYIYIILVLCEGEISSIGDIYLNDDLSTDSKFSGLVTVTKYLGTDTQVADPTFMAANIGWTSAHRLRGTAYLAVRLKWDTDAFSSVPTINAVVQGKKIFTGSTTEYSANPAWCWRDYMTNSRYGKGLPTSFINDTLVASAAAKCDESVTPYSGGSAQPIFSCNAVIDTNVKILDNVKELLSGMRGLMPYQDGQYGLIIEDEGSSTFTFDESNIIDNFSLTSETKKTKFNRVIATYTNPLANWQEDQVQYPLSGSALEATYLAEDGGTVLESRIVLPTITSKYTALDIAEIVLNRSRNGLVVSFNATSEALNVVVGQVVGVTHSTPDWSNKPFRVVNLGLSPEGAVSVDLIEHQDSIYPWSLKTEADNIPDTNLPDPFSVLAPTPFSVTEELYATVNSKGTQTRAIFNWTAPNDAFVSDYEAEYKINGSAGFTFITKTSALSARVEDIAAGRYDFRVRSVNSMAIKSAWAYQYNKTISGLTAIPSDLSNFTIRALDGQCHISWARVVDLDVINGGYVRIRHTPLTSGAAWSNGQDIGEAIAGSQTYTVLPLLAGTYMAKAVDEGGRFSTNAKFSTTTVPNIVDFNAVETLTEHSSFPGTKTNMVVDNGVLILTGGLTVAGSGSYIFSNSIDFGASYTSRLTANMKSSVAEVTDLIDNRTNNIDIWPTFDGESSDAIVIVLQLRSTYDNPSSSPTWSDWVPFLVGDYHARGYQFRVVVTNADSSYNISITELSVSVDMPDRVEKSNDLSLSSGGTSVVFGSSFKAVPVIGVTMQDANSGDYIRVTSKLRTGFTVRCFNALDTGIVRSINWQAVGYGKEAV